MANVTIYLPDELRARAARASGINLSRLLQRALRDELQRQEEASRMLEDAWFAR